jgi:hypothetical protein
MCACSPPTSRRLTSALNKGVSFSSYWVGSLVEIISPCYRTNLEWTY